MEIGVISFSPSFLLYHSQISFLFTSKSASDNWYANTWLSDVKARLVYQQEQSLSCARGASRQTFLSRITKWQDGFFNFICTLNLFVLWKSHTSTVTNENTGRRVTQSCIQSHHFLSLEVIISFSLSFHGYLCTYKCYNGRLALGTKKQYQLHLKGGAG